MSGNATAVLATDDARLRAELDRSAAAAGVSLDLVADVDQTMRAWATARVLFVGADRLNEVAARRPPRRDGVHVLCLGAADAGVLRDALRLSAQEVLELPTGSSALADLMAEVVDEGAHGLGWTIGVVGGSGGAGATTLAGALALVAGRRGPSALVDLDRCGPGLTHVLGDEDAPGTDWETFLGRESGEPGGRLGSRSLRAALPQVGGTAVLSWRGHGRASAETAPAELPGSLALEVVSGLQRGHRVVVVDLPRGLEATSAEVVVRCDEVVVVCTSTVSSVLAARKVVSVVTTLQARVGVVVRRGTGSLPPEEVAGALGLPLVVSYPTRRRVADDVELGQGPAAGQRSSLARAATVVLARHQEHGGLR